MFLEREERNERGEWNLVASSTFSVLETVCHEVPGLCFIRSGVKQVDSTSKSGGTNFNPTHQAARILEQINGQEVAGPGRHVGKARSLD